MHPSRRIAIITGSAAAALAVIMTWTAPATAAWCGGPEAYVSTPSTVPEETVFWGTGQRWFTLGAERRMAHDQESTSPTPFITEYASLLNPNEEVDEFFVCPLQNNYKDRYLGFYPACGEDDDHARIWVLDQNSSEGHDVECQLRAVDPYGITYTGSSYESSSGSSSNGQALTFESFDPRPDHYWYFWCKVPKAVDSDMSGVIAYYMIHEEIVDLEDSP